MNKTLQALVATVQHNCHIADARYAGDNTMCVYLLKMREMYRWEQGESFDTTLTSDDIGNWLVERESVWDKVEGQDYQPLLIEDVSYDAFDNEAINVLLKEKELVYNAGLGTGCRAHFFLAELLEYREYDDYRILISGQEYARDMGAPPAMAQGSTIFIRMESLRRMLWEKVEEWQMSGLDNPIGRAAVFYDFDNNLEDALDAMAKVEADIIIAHEMGEVKVGKLLDEQQWAAMLTELPARSHAELMLRAIRDQLADMIQTLPLLLSNQNAASLHFYFGNMSAMRKKLTPELYAAYEYWYEKDDLSQLQTLVESHKIHWENIAKKAIQIFHSEPDNVQAASQIEAMVADNLL